VDEKGREEQTNERNVGEGKEDAKRREGGEGGREGGREGV